jgi:aspartyl protease family protein
MILAAILIVFGTSMAKVADQMTSEKAQAHSVDKAKAMNAFASVFAALRFRATAAAISRPRAASMAAGLVSWSIPVHQSSR